MGEGERGIKNSKKEPFNLWTASSETDLPLACLITFFLLLLVTTTSSSSSPINNNQRE